MFLSFAIVIALPFMFLYSIIKGLSDDNDSNTNTKTKASYKYTVHTETPDEENRRTDYWGLDDEWGVFK